MHQNYNATGLPGTGVKFLQYFLDHKVNLKYLKFLKNPMCAFMYGFNYTLFMIQFRVFMELFRALKFYLFSAPYTLMHLI